MCNTSFVKVTLLRVSIDTLRARWAYNNLKMILLSWWNHKSINLILTSLLKIFLNYLLGTLEIKIIPITWIIPPPLRVKLNSDGSCCNGQSRGEGIIRDQEGDFIFAYSIPLGNGTSNTAEAETLLYGLQWCARKGLEIVIGETNSLLLTKSVKREWKPPWKISNQVREIQKIIEDHKFNTVHCFGETKMH
uniref:RNase H type-1 domain-containing protein n=1 Tax=Solanum lycopersicum TaxID=4081 RepID=A0A3Q7JWC0_SOLLC